MDIKYKNGDIILTKWREWHVIYKVIGTHKKSYKLEILYNVNNNSPDPKDYVIGFSSHWGIETIEERSNKIHNVELFKVLYV